MANAEYWYFAKLKTPQTVFVLKRAFNNIISTTSTLDSSRTNQQKSFVSHNNHLRWIWAGFPSQCRQRPWKKKHKRIGWDAKIMMRRPAILKTRATSIRRLLRRCLAKGGSKFPFLAVNQSPLKPITGHKSSSTTRRRRSGREVSFSLFAYVFRNTPRRRM